MTETATYNKLYIRILCLIVSHFHFELKDLESWGSAIDEKMQLTVQDSMSARALRQLNFIKNRNQLTVPQKATVVEENKEEMEEDKKEEMEEEDAEIEQEVEQGMEEEEKSDSLVAEPKPLSQEDREKILRLVLMVLIPDLRKSVCVPV